MTTNSLPPNIRFALDLIGPAVGSSFGLGFAIRTDPESSRVPGSVGTFTWAGLWGTIFWVDPAERLIAVQMIQIAPTDDRGHAVHAISDGEFYVDGGDHTRIAFIGDGSGKITGAILNPGAREIKGVKID